MTIEKWLSDVYQDNYVGTKIWNKVTDGGSEMVADIRGWGALQYKFKTNEDAKSFQNEVCKFIVESIREKIERTYKSKGSDMSEKPTNCQTELSDEQIEQLAKDYILYNDSKRQWYIEGMKIYREELKNIK